MSVADQVYLLREQTTLVAGTPKILDVRAFSRAVAFFGGTLSVTPVADSAGTAIPSAAAENPTSGVIFDLKGLFVEFEAGVSDATLILLM